MKKAIIIILIVLVVGGVGGYLIINYLKPAQTEILPPTNILPTEDSTVAKPVVGSETEKFESRGGWSIEYPKNWTFSSCKNCPDPTNPNVYVTFTPPIEIDPRDGQVQIIPLAGKSSDKTKDEWYALMKASIAPSTVTFENKITIDGIEAYLVRFKDEGGTIEGQSVFMLTNDNRAFVISIGSRKPNVTVLNLGNYPVYEKMLNSFKIGVAQKSAE